MPNRSLPSLSRFAQKKLVLAARQEVVRRDSAMSSQSKSRLFVAEGIPAWPETDRGRLRRTRRATKWTCTDVPFYRSGGSVLVRRASVGASLCPRLLCLSLFLCLPLRVARCAAEHLFKTFLLRLGFVVPPQIDFSQPTYYHAGGYVRTSVLPCAHSPLAMLASIRQIRITRLRQYR